MNYFGDTVSHAFITSFLCFESSYIFYSNVNCVFLFFKVFEAIILFVNYLRKFVQPDSTLHLPLPCFTFVHRPWLTSDLTR